MTIISVVGAGAIGAFVGTRLSIAGATVRLIGRTTLTSDVKNAGNKITTQLLSAPAFVSIIDNKQLTVTESLSEGIKDADIILVCVKSSQTEAVAKELLTLLPPDKHTTIISLQNGVANSRTLSSYLGQTNHCLAGIVEFNVVWQDSATFVMLTSGYVMVADDAGSHAALFSGLLGKGGLAFLLKKKDEMESFQYGKIVLNLTNAINALTGVPILEMFKDPLVRKVLSASASEAINVLQEAKIIVKSTKAPVNTFPFLMSLSPFFFSIAQPLFIKINANAKTSMLKDVEANKVTEIDFINGEVLRVAKASGLKAPKVNSVIVGLIKEAEKNKMKSPMMTGKDLVAAIGL